jgi:hypothetical protein
MSEKVGSSRERGQLRELVVSASFHSEGVPLLVSSQVLRSLGMGQIDLARVKCSRQGQKLLEICEVKSKVAPTVQQYLRLKRAGDWLGHLLALPCRIIVDSE